MFKEVIQNGNKDHNVREAENFRKRITECYTKMAEDFAEILLKITAQEQNT